MKSVWITGTFAGIIFGGSFLIVQMETYLPFNAEVWGLGVLFLLLVLWVYRSAKRAGLDKEKPQEIERELDYTENFERLFPNNKWIYSKSQYDKITQQ